MTSPDSLIQMSLLGEAVEDGPIGVLVADDNMRYIAANDYVCRMLGYDRIELLRLRVTDVAQTPTAPDEYAEMIRTGVRFGTIDVTKKDGSTLEVNYRASETSVAGMTLYVSVVWPAE
ncbi:MAG: PAS domain-containing protein [Gaiellaceae bacterium]|jgi:PAS domain S-box-containing protein